MEILKNLFGFILLSLFIISTIIGRGESLPLKFTSEISINSAETIQDDFFGTIGDNQISSSQSNNVVKRVLNHFSFSFLLNINTKASPASIRPYNGLYHIDIYKGPLSIYNLVLRI